jgi:hypothetical protein
LPITQLYRNSRELAQPLLTKIPFGSSLQLQDRELSPKGITAMLAQEAQRSSPYLVDTLAAPRC